MKINGFTSRYLISFVLILLNLTLVKASEEITAYYKIATLNESIDKVSEKVKTALSEKDFEIIGEYNPGNRQDLKVIAYTRTDLQSIVLNNKQGLLAGIMKVGLQKTNEGVVISIINPLYLFNAYLMETIKQKSDKLQLINKDIRVAMATINNSFTPFGGKISAEDLWEYHYMFGMPYFTDQVVLRTFESFDEGVKIIKANLARKVGNTIKVYEVIKDDEKVAVFGIGLLDSETGEAHFLPIIGESHVAAMPYEIILQGNKATMLHGRFRIALHWPELTMGTFTQIMSTPGDIEETLEKLVK